MTDETKVVDAPKSDARTWREIVERVASDAIQLAVIRHGLAPDDEPGEPFDVQEIVDTTTACLTGDDIGCGDEEDADDPEKCAGAFVRRAMEAYALPIQQQRDAAQLELALFRSGVQQVGIEWRDDPADGTQFPWNKFKQRAEKAESESAALRNALEDSGLDFPFMPSNKQGNSLMERITKSLEVDDCIEGILKAFGWVKDDEATANIGTQQWARYGEEDGAYNTSDAVTKALEDYDALRAAHKKAHLLGAGLAVAIREFIANRGKHKGEHTFTNYSCGKCDESYVIAEAKLDAALEEK